MPVRVVAACVVLAWSTVAWAARPTRPSLADTFRLGSGGDTLCQLQRSAEDAAAPGLFDRAYALACRDAAAPVGRLYALRSNAGDPLARLNRLRHDLSLCVSGGTTTLPDAGAVSIRQCRTVDGLGYDILAVSRDRTVFVAEGLAGYRSALELGLRTLVADRIVAGQITIALTGAGDAAAFARVQAGSLDPALALSEGYRRNNSGNYAEASEFFATLFQRSLTGSSAADAGEQAEYLVNRALQQSDLGNYAAAAALFAQAEAIPSTDPVALRHRRNYRALDLVNRGSLSDALRMLEAPIARGTVHAEGAVIDRDTAVALNERAPLAAQLGVGRTMGLTPVEKAALLDAQALALRGTVLRLENRAGDATAALDQAMSAIDAIRGGRVASVARLRAQVITDRAALAEAAGNLSSAEGLLRQAVEVIATEYPDSVTFDIARARLAGLLSRRGKTDEALTLYHQVAVSLGKSGGAPASLADLLDPYFALLVDRLPQRPALADDLFLASQVLPHPGVADTQATLARELSGGSGEAGRLFRESLNQTREANVLRRETARLLALADPNAEERAAIAAGREELARLEREQTGTQARLATLPAYRAIETQVLTLAELRSALRAGEAYWKLAVAGRSIYALLITADTARAWRLAIDPDALARRVEALRGTIAGISNGAPITYPFDAPAARALYLELAGPAAADLPKIGHLIFEPDGAMLSLPISLLIVGQGGLDRYLARQRLPVADPFDMTGVDWLGATVEISVALSPRAFRDVRQTPASKAPKAYLGFGQNAVVPPYLQLTGYAPSHDVIDCRWPLASWNHPIAPDELYSARAILGADNSTVVTGAAFNDTDILRRNDLARYRIVHFATHGLVVAPRPECPAQPALLTSFGGKASDGLLSFSEIYRLHFDADLILLSACDTAGSADVSATRAAGIETGGGNALDGLVRAFIGAGARSVLASHWPAPDDYRATEQLIGGLFTAPTGTPIAEALRLSQRRLMAVRATSHPYYWAGFALIGDGARPVRSTSP